jgi:cyclic beta-1,2-glucan synthetase
VEGHPARVSGSGAPDRPAARPAPPQDSEGDRETLRFDNGIGGFSEDGREYVIRVDGSAPRPPVPWVNVIANERIGFLVSESGSASTWGCNSREYRLTPWSNDPVLDPHTEALYVRDQDTGAFWSPLPGPAGHGGAYEVRHGMGVSTFRH